MNVKTAIRIFMTDAELLATWMKKQNGGLTQAQAANWLGMTQPGINAVLKGKNALSGAGRKFVEHLLDELTPAPAPERHYHIFPQFAVSL